VHVRAATPVEAVLLRNVAQALHESRGDQRQPV